MSKKNKVREVIVKRSTFIIMLLLILSAVTLIRLVTTRKDISDVGNIDIPLIEVLTEIETNQLEQSINFERALRYAEEIALNPYAQEQFRNADSTFRYLAKMVDNDLIRAEQSIEKSFTKTAQESQLIKLKALDLAVKKLESDHIRYEEHALEVIEMLEQGRVSEALIKAEKVEAEEDQFNKQLEGTLMRHELFTEALVQSVEQQEVLSIKTIVILTLSFVVLSLVAVYTFSYRIWRPLEDIREGAEKLGAGRWNTRIKLRSNSITEEIVDSFNSMADNLEKSKEELENFIKFSASTVHDLKLPVSNLKSTIEMLENTGLTQANYEAIVKTAKRTNDRLIQTLEGLDEINLVRQNLQLPGEKIPFELALREVGVSLMPLIKKNQATLKVDFSQCDAIEYPKSHLFLILKHLIQNALIFRNPAFAPVIQIKSAINKGEISVYVKDNGLGFDKTSHGETLTQPFVRLHPHIESNGLGLFLVNMVLSHHGGKIQFESTPQKGTLVKVIFN